MPLREFVDHNGVEWRVWSVSPAQVHKRSRDEKLFIGYELGWLAFESANGELRRRLCPCPVNWDRSTDEGLERLCAEADVVPPSRRPSAAAAARASEPADDDKSDIARVSIQVREDEEAQQSAGLRRRQLRTFHFPGGRIWTVGVMTTTGEQGARDVLCFMSGSHSVRLERWPDDWFELPDHQLAELLRQGAPARPGAANPTAHRRRHDDQHP